MAQFKSSHVLPSVMKNTEDTSVDKESIKLVSKFLELVSQCVRITKLLNFVIGGGCVSYSYVSS
jgi:hypothetical protein